MTVLGVPWKGVSHKMDKLVNTLTSIDFLFDLLLAVTKYERLSTMSSR